MERAGGFLRLRGFAAFAATVVLGVLAGLVWPAQGVAQDRTLTVAVLINTQNAAGFNASPTQPGEFQRFAERYFEHLQVPYDLIDVASVAPPAALADRQLIVAGHSGLNLSAAWRTAIADAVASGVGFVNLDADVSVGLQSHIQSIFGASGSSVGVPGTAITVPEDVLVDGGSRHFIAALQQRFAGDPAGDIVYDFHPDAGGILRTVTPTVLTGATGTVIARIGSSPLILATTFGAGRAVHFGTLEYLRADRFGFLMGVDDLFWRSLVWAARKPFVLRGYPRFWSIQMDDTLPGWGQRVRDMYDPAFTGTVAEDGTGGPWRVTGYVYTDNLPPGSPERAVVINDINAGNLQISPHARGPSEGDYYWEDDFGAPLTPSSWLVNVQDIDAWLIGNGGADEIPFMSRSMVPHFWNLSDITGSDLWNGLGFRYITEIQRPGAYFFTKSDADRVRLRPFRVYEVPPASSPDENYPVYVADDYVVNSRPGLPPQTFFGFTTQIIDLDRYDRQDVAWPNATRPISESVDHFQYYTWRLWSSLAPTQIYTHDGGGGGGNYVLSTPAERQEVIRQVSSWLNARGARHVFMEELGAYMRARATSVLTDAALVDGELVLTFSGSAGTETETQFYGGSTEGAPVTVSSFAGGAVVSIPVEEIVSNPLPVTTGLSPASGFALGPAFTLTVNGTGFVPGAQVRWNGNARPTTFVSPTELTAAIPASDLASAGTASVTVFNPAPGGGLSNAQTFTILAAANPVPVLTSLTPAGATVGGPGFTLTLAGSGFMSGSVVRWNGADRATTFVSPTELTAVIPASDIASTGTASVTVFNPAPGGGTSEPQSFSVTAAQFFDDFTRADGEALGNGWVEKSPGAFALSGNRVVKASGGTFANNLVYRPAGESMLDGEASVEVRFASLPPGYAQVFVRGQTATIATPSSFTGYLLFIDNAVNRAYLDRIENGTFVPLSEIALSPTLNTTDTYRLRLRATGTNPVVVAAYVERLTESGWTVIGQATVNDAAATRVATAGTVGFTGHVEGGIYSYDNFTRASFDGASPEPTTTGISPSTGAAGGGAFTLTVNGTGFVPESEVRWNGSARPTTFVSSTQLTAPIPASDVASVGAASVTVFNPAPGGGLSNEQTYTITAPGNPLPVLTALAPTGTPVGGPGFTLTLSGSGFMSGSVVRWNGADRATTFVSPTELTAMIPASDIASTGTASVTVFNPAPGGGTSEPQSFSVTAAQFFDDFTRADGEALGNGWVEKTPGAFALSGNRVVKASGGTFANNLVYRPAGESMLDGEASVEVRFGSLPPGYAQVFVRGQTATIATPSSFTGYLLFVDNAVNRAYLDRIENGAFVPLSEITLSPTLNTTDTYRLRLRATGTNPVVVSAYVERLTESGWTVIGQATVNDAAATRVATAGTVGFTGHVEGGVYSYDNFTWTTFDGANPEPTTTGISPSTGAAGGGAFTLTVNGTGFVPESEVRWNGSARATTFVSATQLTASIPAIDVASVGAASVTVFNPAPGGGLSNDQTYTITAPGNPLPVLTALAPTGAPVGGPGFTLTLSGSGFMNGSVVRWNGADRATTFVSPTELTAVIPASDLASPGTASVTVFNPAPGGGTSEPQSFSVTSAQFFDDFERADGEALGNGWVEKTPGAFALSGSRVVKASGGTFANNLVYRPAAESMLDGEASVEVRFASLPPGYAQVFVRGQTATIATPNSFTGYLLFTDNAVNRAYLDRIENGTFVPLSEITLSPTLNTTDTYRLRLRATGTNPVVVAAYVERLTGSGWTVIGQATVNDVAATRVATAGTVGFTGHVEGGIYSYDNFTWTSFDGTNPEPTTTSISPSTGAAGGGSFTLTVNGTGFVPESEVRWNGSARATTFVSSTQLTASIAASDVASVGGASVTVFNPAPGGGLSNGQTYTITAPGNPLPVLTALAPTGAPVGGPGFTLTLSGSGFMNGSVVRWNGADRATTFVSPTELTAVIPASDLTSAGTASVTVFNPTPGGGTSEPQSFLVSMPGGSFLDDFNRPNDATIGNDWTEKFPSAFSILNNEVVSINTDPIDYHDAIVYRPQSEDRRDVEVSLEFRVLANTMTFPQVHARVQRDTIEQADTLEGYLFFVDGFEPSPGRAIIARQQAVPGQFECYMLGIPFPSPLQTNERYRLRFRVTGGGPVTLQGFVERYNGSGWESFASGSVTHDVSGVIPPRDPGLYCDPGFMPGPLTTPGAVGFAKWVTNNEVIDNFSWSDLNDGSNPLPATIATSPAAAASGGSGFTLTVTGVNFVPGSVVRWNGADRPTTFVSATQLTAAISAADVATAGVAEVTVFTPAPGGGLSNPQEFLINNPGAVTVDFDDPAPPGSPGALTGNFEGVNFGTAQWAWGGPFGPNPTNHIYFDSASGTSRTLQFSAGARILDSVTVYALSTGTLTLSDDQGQVRSQVVNPGSLVTVATGWTQPSTTVTVDFTAGWDLGLDDIVHR